MYFIEISLAPNHRLIVKESEPMRHDIIMFTTTSRHMENVFGYIANKGDCYACNITVLEIRNNPFGFR